LIEYLFSNKEWIFSGLGSTTLVWVWAVIARRKRFNKTPKPALPQQKAHREKTGIVTKISESEKISKRFQTVLDLMNGRRNYKKYTIYRLAEILDLDNGDYLQDIFLGETSPTFDFMQKFCEVFGVFYPWLSYGEGAPFENEDRTMYYPSYETFEKIIPDRIYFIRSKSTGEAFSVLKFTDWKYLITYKSWPIHAGTGHGGQNQIVDFHRLILKLQKNGFYDRLRGLHLEENEFRPLHHGSIFPGKFLDSAVDDYWWMHFTDVTYKYWTAEDYTQKYDKNFIEAQKVVQYGLQRDLA